MRDREKTPTRARPARMWCPVNERGWLYVWAMASTRREVIAKWEDGLPGEWARDRRKGWRMARVEVSEVSNA